MTGIKPDASLLIHGLAKEQARRREAMLGAGRTLAARTEGSS
jgi:hypothetical protein